MAAPAPEPIAAAAEAAAALSLQEGAGTAPAAAPASADAAAPASSGSDTIVQFVVVRRDLLKDLEWPVGSVIAQACHACTAVIWTHREDEHVQQYLSDANIGSMHKVVKECKGETQLVNLAEKLKQEGIAHELWLEQPENFPTAVALKPYPREKVAPLLKKYQLFK